MSFSFFVYRTPLGRLSIESDGGAITRVAYGPMRLRGEERPSALCSQASTEILEYLAGKRRAFEVPVALSGSDFQKAVWCAIEAVPYGEVRTYAQIAEAIGRPRAMRAVGNACGKNRLPILVPCHRVVGANGNLGGYTVGSPDEASAAAQMGAPSLTKADGVRIKRYLIDLEARCV